MKTTAEIVARIRLMREDEDKGRLAARKLAEDPSSPYPASQSSAWEEAIRCACVMDRLKALLNWIEEEA